jgi:uncharacterized protein involved in response to NO
MSRTAEQMRAWQGPALLTYGFRPFFLGAALWAVLSMALWVGMLAGLVDLPTALDPVSWHVHAFLFGYLGAVIAGFLLTAVPNWTGRLPIMGWPLAGLVGLWGLGRVAVSVSDGVPVLAVALADLAFPLALAAVLAREIVAGRNWRNLIVLAMLLVFALGQALFHLEAARGGFPAQGAGLRLALAAAVMMIAVIGGRVVPSFTRNWLVRQGGGPLPVPPMQRFDKVALLVLLVALLAWVMRPESVAAGVALGVAGLVHLLRLARWAGLRTGAEPLVWVLHAGYGFVPLGALALAVAVLWPAVLAPGAALHLWLAGAIGVMSLAVMTRATLGHAGQALTAGRGTQAIYGLMLLSVLARLGAGLWPGQAEALHLLAGLGWLGAFGLFALLYGGLHLRPLARG